MQTRKYICYKTDLPISFVMQAHIRFEVNQ